MYLVYLGEFTMSEFKDKSIEEILPILEKDYKKINIFDVSNLLECKKLAEIIRQKPGYFLALKEDKIMDEIAIAFLEKNINLFGKITTSARSTSVKLFALQKKPSIADLFEANDYDYETVKYLYVNYPFMLEDLEPKAQQVVDNIVKKLKNEKVEIDFERD